MEDDREDDDFDGSGYREVEVREQDRLLPIANINRIMKKVLPNNAKVSKDAKESFQECISEFISFITCEASEKCLQEKRKTINGDDILWAMSTLGFEKYIEPLKIYLSKYRESAKGDRSGNSKCELSSQPKTSRDSYYHGQSSVARLSSTLTSSGKAKMGHVHLPPPPPMTLQPPISLTQGIGVSSGENLLSTSNSSVNVKVENSQSKMQNP